MEALRLVAEMLREDEDGGFDRQQFDDAIDRVAAARPPPQLLGAVLALCVQSNYRGVAELCAVMTGSFTGSVDAPEDRIGVLRGILFIAPELVWRHEQLLAAIDQLLRELSDEEFLELLPHIRLAFTALNPRETDRVADMLVRMHGGQSGQYVSYRHDLDEADLAQGLEMEQGLREAIDADGLALWLEGSE